MKRLMLSVLIVISLVLMAGYAFAGTASGLLNVTTNVISGCTVSVGSIIFGNYASNQAADIVVTDPNAVQVTCGTGTLYSIVVGLGSNYTAGRNMNNGPNYLPYELRDPAASDAPIPVSPTDWKTNITATGATENHAIKGFLSGGQTVPAGPYSDSVAVNVNW